MANPFDQFDAEANPFDQFDHPTTSPARELGKKILGGVEGVFSAASSLAAAIPTGFRALAELPFTGNVKEALERAESTTDAATYIPRTDIGKSVSKEINQTLSDYQQEVADKYSGDTSFLTKQKLRRGEKITKSDLDAENTERTVGEIIGSLYAPGIGKFGRSKPTAEDLSSKAKKAFDEEKAATENPFDQFDTPQGSTQHDPFAQMKQQLGADQTMPMGPERPEGYVPPEAPMNNVAQGLTQMAENQRTSAAQRAIDERQAQMELEVKRQAGLDFNAAERARQEAAPVLPEYNQMRQGDAAMAGMADRLTDPRDGQNARLPNGSEPIYVDPQAQAFRGNPAEADPRLALEQQTQAMDRELTHLQGKETPTGEPLRPLRDIPVEQNRDLAKEIAKEQGTAADTNRSYAETPISSKGPKGRQRGAIATKEIVDSLRNGFETAVKALGKAFHESPYQHLQARNLISTLTELIDKHPEKAGAILAHTSKSLEDLGYPTSVIDAVDRAYQANDTFQRASKSTETDRVTTGAFNQTRKALLNIDKQIDDLVNKMEALIKTRDVPGRQGVINLANAERGTKQRWRNLANKVADLEEQRDALNIQSPLREEHLRTNDFTSPFDNSYAVEGVDMDAVRRNLPQEAGTTDNVLPFNRIPLRQRGAVGDLRPRPSQTGVNAEVVGKPKEKPIDPAAVAKRNALASSKLTKNLGLDEFDTIHSKDEALTLATGAKDIPKNYGQKELMSGINTATILSNNPVLKFARTVFRDARNYADKFSRTFITDDKTGLSPLWSKMNSGERVAAMEALMEGDRRQMPVSDSVMQRMEFTDAQKQFIKTFYAADKALFDMGNEAMAKLGLQLTDERSGHFPGVFRGAYKTVAFTRGEKGRIKVLGVIATDTMAQSKMAREWTQKQFPNAEFLDRKRMGMAGQRYGGADILSGMNDVLDILSREDPTFKEVQDILDGAVKQANNALFNFNVHQLHKKGVFGNAGNKPWFSPEKNANEAFKALVGYFEEGSMHHALQVPLKEVRETLVAPETDHMPNMKKYLTDYTKKVTGEDLNDVGRALNGLLDFPFRFTPSMSFGIDGVKFGMGVGPSVPLKFAGALKNNMSQLYMGWLNYMFTASQLVQPLQTGLPFLQLVAGRIGANPLEVPYALAKGGIQFLAAATEHLVGHDMGVVDPVMRDAFKYAVDRGMATFSEMERAYQGTQTRVGRMKDQVAEVNMKLGEQLTRTPMFMSFADVLVRNGMEKQKAFEIAENLTQEAMIDYHQWERPMVYSKLGVVGGFMGGLTTFKHGFVGQQVYLGKQAIKPAVGKHQVAPIAASLGTMMIFAGITGLPFYQELDSMYHQLTNKFGDQARSIREDFLQQLPDWLQHGYVSAATNLNMQGKFSSADMVPDADHAFRAVSPHLEGAAKIAGSAYDVLKNGGDDQSVRNLAINAAPSGWRGAVENSMSRDQDNYLVGKESLPMFKRTDEEWQTRALTGLRSQREANERESVWDQRLTKKADDDRKKEIAQEYKRRILNNNMDEVSQKKLEGEYQDRKGDVRQLIQLWEEATIEKTKDEKQRLEGTPSSLPGFNRWEYFNK
jgi:hypothetical protein